MKYNIPVTWSSWGIITVEADDIETAKQEAITNSSLPVGEYIEDSIEVDEEGIYNFNPSI